MRKLKKFVLRSYQTPLSASAMKDIEGGKSGDKVKCVCSCKSGVGTWTSYCEVDSLYKSFYAYDKCGGNYYASCGTAY